jgi:hypothetical protein
MNRKNPQKDEHGINGASLSPSAPGDSNPSADARAHHYERWFGKPRMFWQENEVESPPVHIVAYPPTPERDRDFFTLVTTGMSDARMPLPPDADSALARAELLLYVLPPDMEFNPARPPWFVSVLHSLAHMPWRRDVWLGEAHTIPNGDPSQPFVPRSPLTTALLLPPIFEPPEFADSLLLNGERVNFYWVTFLTDSECQYKLEHGYEALMQKFEDVNFPHVLDAFRPSTV